MSTYTIEEPKTVESFTTKEGVESSSMNVSQRRAFWRIHRFWQQRLDGQNIKGEVAKMTFEAELLNYGFWTVTFKIERTDCAFGSLRHALCGDGGNFHIGKRGAIKVCNSYAIPANPGREATKAAVVHIARCVRGKAGY